MVETFHLHGRKAFPYLLLIACVFAAYVNIYGNSFLFDDQTLIVENDFLRYWHSLPLLFSTPIMAGSHTSSDFYRPLQTFLYFFIFLFGDLSTFGFHLLNVSLHAANACLLYRLGCKMLFNPAAVLIAALLWALHPIHTEAIAYISGTADPLYSFFCLIGLIVLLPNFTPRKFFIAALCCILALLSKETAVVFPLLAMICLFALKRDRLGPKTYFCAWPLWFVVLIYFFVRMALLSFDSHEFINLRPELQDYGQHISLRIYTFLATLPSYAWLLLWPQGLHMERSFPVATTLTDPTVLAGLALIGVSLVLMQREMKRKETPGLSWGLLWFAAAYAPQTGILIPVNALLLEHWMYLPTAGLALGLAQYAATQLKQLVLTKILAATACMGAIVLAVATYQQNTLWHDPVVFYRNILEQGEVSVRAHNNLGMALTDNGDYTGAMEQFQAALKIRDAAETHQNIASLYSRIPEGGPKMVPQEIAELQRALDIDPNYYQAAKDLAFLYGYSGDAEKAAEYSQRAEAIRQKYTRYP